jgi:hypothetical protein
MRMKDFGTAGGQRVRFIITQVMQKFGFDGSVGISGKNSVHVGPDDEFFGVHDVGNDRAGKIGAIAAERGDTSVGSRTNETGDDGDEAGFEKRKKSGTAPLAGFFQLRLGVAERVTGKDEIGGSDGDSGDSGLLETGGKETSAEAFAKGGEAIGEFGAGGNMAI